MKKFSEVFMCVARIILLASIVGIPYYFIWQELKNLNIATANQNIAQFMLLDAQVLNLHYAAGHKPFEMLAKNDGSGTQIPMCRQCYRELDELGALNKPIELVLQERYQELLEKERQLNEILKPIPMKEIEGCLKH